MKKGAPRDKFTSAGQSTSLYVRHRGKWTKRLVLLSRAGNHPLLCTQGVKVTFHNTFETGLMEGLLHGFCWMEIRNHDKGCNKRWKYVKGMDGENEILGQNCRKERIERSSGTQKYVNMWKFCVHLFRVGTSQLKCHTHIYTHITMAESYINLL